MDLKEDSLNKKIKIAAIPTLAAAALAGAFLIPNMAKADPAPFGTGDAATAPLAMLTDQEDVTLDDIGHARLYFNALPIEEDYDEGVGVNGEGADPFGPDLRTEHVNVMPVRNLDPGANFPVSVQTFQHTNGSVGIAVLDKNGDPLAGETVRLTYVAVAERRPPAA